MKPIAFAGLLLIIAGIAGLALGRFSYVTERKVVDIGPIKASVEEQHNIAIPDIAGFVAIIAGVGLVVIGRRSAA